MSPMRAGHAGCGWLPCRGAPGGGGLGAGLGRRPVRTHQSNFIGTLNVCEAMRVHGVRRVLFASSAAVYGNNGEGESIAEDTPKAPLTPMPWTSWPVSNTWTSTVASMVWSRWFRFFNIFGPRQDPSSPYSGVISIFCERAVQGLPITVFGDGEQTRDFLYVGDLVQVMVQALEQPQVEEGAVNIGLNQATSLNQLLAALEKVVGACQRSATRRRVRVISAIRERITSGCWRGSNLRR
jgi:UDP-glucose 4-epimerase